MSIKTTHKISRDTAVAVILSKVHTASNEVLEEILERFEESHFRNYVVQNDISDYPKQMPSINSPSDF